MTCKETYHVLLTTDAQYVRQGITNWPQGWKRNGWRTAAKAQVTNVGLWKALDEQNQRHRVDWHWIKGHSGHRESGIADQLANWAIDEMVSRGIDEMEN